MEVLTYSRSRFGARPIIQMRRVRKLYYTPTPHTVFHNVNLDVRRGEFIALIGPIGCGKTTLINLIAGIERPTSGSITLDGREITRLSDSQLAALRAAQMGIVHQVQRLLLEFTVRQNVELPLFLLGVKGEQRRARAIEVLKRLGIVEQKDRKVSTLSVGERQMVCIARAMVCNPPIILMDEPTESLDPLIREVILSLLRGDNMVRGRTLIIATHDRKIMEMADRTVRVKKSIP